MSLGLAAAIAAGFIAGAATVRWWPRGGLRDATAAPAEPGPASGPDLGEAASVAIGPAADAPGAAASDAGRGAGCSVDRSAGCSADRSAGCSTGCSTGCSAAPASATPGAGGVPVVLNPPGAVPARPSAPATGVGCAVDSRGAIDECPLVERRLRELTDILERSTDYIAQTDRDGRVLYLNPAARRDAGIASDAPLGELNFFDFATDETRTLWATQIVPGLKARGIWVGESTLRIGERGVVPLSHMVIAHKSPDGLVERFSSVMRDISHEVGSRQALKRQADILRAVTEAIPTTVVVVDSRGRYQFANGAFARYVGRAREDIIGRTAVEVLGAEEIERRKPYMKQAMAGATVEFTLDYPGPDDTTTTLALTCVPLQLDGLADGFVGLSQDVTRERQERERLQRMVQRDPLTGLLNRAGFEDHILRIMQDGHGASLALLYIDLDHFKPVNDSFGHLTGDSVLQVFADRLAQQVRASDAVARLGGDEFAVLLPGLRDPAHATHVAQKILAAAEAPFTIDGQPIRISASVGVAVGVPADGNWRTLVARADEMLYRAKAAGRARQMAEA